MEYLDSTDQRLIALLRRDGRASVTTLAGDLGVARATVQTRLARLINDGTIRRFTVELASPSSDDLIHAIMFIELQGNLARTVVSAIRKIPQIAQLHTTNGAWDLVAQIEATSLADFDKTLWTVREVKGVSNSETCILLDHVK